MQVILHFRHFAFIGRLGVNPKGFFFVCVCDWKWFYWPIWACSSARANTHYLRQVWTFKGAWLVEVKERIFVGKDRFILHNWLAWNYSFTRMWIQFCLDFKVSRWEAVWASTVGKNWNSFLSFTFVNTCDQPGHLKSYWLKEQSLLRLYDLCFGSESVLF